ncbi:hypothetical protein RF11_02831 [Thelohanellus kitauei]|uniref:type II protein arginine methyltransferase n=1 Tax=Thelohanellus kitauei TaxID=669202 RepID=A0A0C2NEF5_THEKT|nr:hypothetical protein RF11_12958 [Thelohanellus kitauei]KII74715.1 hypothetical protein RF11_02831 [Thelohanellus kitauei]
MIARWVKSIIERKDYERFTLVEMGPGNGTMINYVVQVSSCNIKALNNYAPKELNFDISLIENSRNQADYQAAIVCDPKTIIRHGKFGTPFMTAKTYNGQNVSWFDHCTYIKSIPGIF